MKLMFMCVFLAACSPALSDEDVARTDARRVDSASADTQGRDAQAADSTVPDAVDVGGDGAVADAPADVLADIVPEASPDAAPDAPVTACSAGYNLIPGGSYTIGSDAADPNLLNDEIPQFTAILSPFCMKRTEVTVAEFRACRVAGRCVNDPDTTADCNWSAVGRDNHPINCVDLAQSVDYCAWIGGRLPTEAEWEGAARGPAWEMYPWGGNPPNDARSNSWARHGNNTQEVGLAGLDRCNNPFGLCDMAGNVEERVSDIYDRPYPAGRVTNPTGPAAGSTYVTRGGAMYSYDPLVRSSRRGSTSATNRQFYFGFRCVTAARSL